MLSIITITFNAEPYLERTIQSILAQTDQDFEYLIIDGGSKDGTLALANKYRDRVNVLVSEPDKGLYDAMNKGLHMAKGPYVWFMNAGDQIAEAEAVYKLKMLMSEGADVIYSDTIMVDEQGQSLGLRSQVTPHRLPEVMHWSKFKYGMLICHQSFVVNKAICPNYDIENLSADIDWEIICLKRAEKISLYPGILSKYLLGGISQKQHRRSLADRYKVLRKHFGWLPNLWNHAFILFRALGDKIK